MSDSEIHEHIEHAAHGHEPAPAARRAAVVIAIMAAALALTELQAKNAQVAYLHDHIAASDIWAQYQGKSTRRTVYNQTADMLASLPSAAEPDIAARVADARKSADRMRSDAAGDGMEQLAKRAEELEHERDHQLHRTHGLETASGGLQISIVLASVSVVTNVRALLFVGIALACAAAGYAVLANQGIV